MSDMLLVEIGCEELPGKTLKSIQNALSSQLTQAFSEHNIPYETLKVFSTPRRLAFQMTDLPFQLAPQEIIKKGPPVSKAYQGGKPTVALTKFAESCQTTIKQLQTEKTEKGEWFIFKQTLPGKPLEAVLPQILTAVLSTLPVGKRMRITEEHVFSRPIRWLVCLYNNNILPIELYGLKASNLTYGHRFLASNPVKIPTAKDYEKTLYKAHVIADFDKRQEAIQDQITSITQKQKITPLIDDSLLDEVTALVEWPVCALGTFKKQFLKLPEPVLITSMQNHQKCFATQKEHLVNHFMMVSNLESTDQQAVIHGNEAVIDARLSDAEFYYETDQKISLLARREQLKQVRFQEKLGTLFDKTERMKALSEFLAKKLGGNVSTVERAAILSKSDLLTQMVGEFPELQGVMGQFYAKLDKEPSAVAEAIEAQYYPRFADDSLPRTLEGSIVSLADKVDTVVGLFSIGKRPTGDKDPFSLRRQALAILRILIENELDVDLKELFMQAANLYSTELQCLPELMTFCFDRLRNYECEQGISLSVFNAVLAQAPSSPWNFHLRLQAVQTFMERPEATILSAANKRVQNILDKQDQHLFKKPIDKTLLNDHHEKLLFERIQEQAQDVHTQVEKRNYTSALNQLTQLATPIDDFFEHVMVMVDNQSIKENRLRLLHQLRALFLQIADLSLL